MKSTVIVQREIYMQYDRHISPGAYANNVECMYTRAPGHTVDFSEFI